MRIHGLDEPLTLEYDGPNEIALDREAAKGEELGYFQHGSTIILFAGPGYGFDAGIEPGRVIRMGQALLRFRNLSDIRE
jgi:phosphatidylserine decarboxylase